MKFSEIASRLNSVGIPWLSVGWTPAKPDAAIARKAIRFLEDRRMLFNACAQEDPHHCYLSAIETRKAMTEALSDATEGSDLFKHLSAIRAACRRFLDSTQGSEERIGPRDFCDFRSGEFFIALGELRASIGYHVALMASKWKINVENDLARVLPGSIEGQ